MASKSFAATALTVSLLINGALAIFAVERGADAASAATRITRLEADVRDQVGKRYNLEEKQQDELEAARSEGQLELWKANQALEACQKGKK